MLETFAVHWSRQGRLNVVLASLKHPVQASDLLRQAGRYVLASQGVAMGLIRDEDAVQIRERLQQMVNPVKLVHFTQELNLELGAETLQLVKELAGLSDKLSLEVFNFLLDKGKVGEYGVDKVPATVIRNGKDYGIRFYGLPAGYEFSTLLDAILAVSKGDSGLLANESKETRPTYPTPPPRSVRHSNLPSLSTGRATGVSVRDGE